ncbi:immunity protein YezG family protein [Oceanobacillus sp. 1P07AA]|uniref:immunity protein YezG family protein n=1 Tax=Oceanobacillus sp. 1P07AA TaxID=3132293 RepID=UPI0039A76150
METRKMEIQYQKAANLLVDMIPEPWEKVFLYAEIREGYSQVYFYYYPENQGAPVYNIDIPDIFDVNIKEYKGLKHDLYYCFEELLNEFSNQGHELWTSLTFILDNSGKMNIDYGYEDISEISPVEKQDKWEEKYLK